MEPVDCKFQEVDSGINVSALNSAYMGLFVPDRSVRGDGNSTGSDSDHDSDDRSVGHESDESDDANALIIRKPLVFKKKQQKRPSKGTKKTPKKPKAKTPKKPKAKRKSKAEAKASTKSKS